MPRSARDPDGLTFSFGVATPDSKLSYLDGSVEGAMTGNLVPHHLLSSYTVFVCRVLRGGKELRATRRMQHYAYLVVANTKHTWPSIVQLIVCGLHFGFIVGQQMSDASIIVIIIIMVAIIIIIISEVEGGRLELSQLASFLPAAILRKPFLLWRAVGFFRLTRMRHWEQ